MTNSLADDIVKDLRKLRDPLEGRFFKEQQEIDQKALALYKKNPRKAKKFLTQYTWKCMSQTVEMYKKLRNILITKYTNNNQGS